MSDFIADSESPCQLKGGSEFCLLTKVLPLVLEAVTQLLDIVALEVWSNLPGMSKWAFLWSIVIQGGVYHTQKRCCI